MTARAVEFHVPGAPQGKGAARIVKIGGFSRMAPAKKTASYEGLIAHEARMAMRGQAPLSGPVALMARIVFLPPASWSGRKRADGISGRTPHVVKPDYDNVLKAIGDGCNGVVWEDDRQIVSCTCLKLYGHVPGLWVTVMPWGSGFGLRVAGDGLHAVSPVLQAEPANVKVEPHSAA